MRSRQTEQNNLRILPMKAIKFIKPKVRFCIAAVRRCFWLIIVKAIFWYRNEIGISFKMKPVYSNDGDSDHCFVIISRHPRRSVTWIWTVWFWKPLTFTWKHKWISIYRQEPMWRDKVAKNVA